MIKIWNHLWKWLFSQYNIVIFPKDNIPINIISNPENYTHVIVWALKVVPFGKKIALMVLTNLMSNTSWSWYISWFIEFNVTTAEDILSDYRK